MNINRSSHFLEDSQTKDAYTIKEKKQRRSYVQNLLKNSSLKNAIILSEILNSPYIHKSEKL